MGTGGLGRFPGLFLGSVAMQVVHLADVPVTLVKETKSKQPIIPRPRGKSGSPWHSLHLPSIAVDRPGAGATTPPARPRRIVLDGPADFLLDGRGRLPTLCEHRD
jgi:hypothetical protein